MGISKFQACAYADKWIKDVKGPDLEEATMVADTAGKAAIEALKALRPRTRPPTRA